MCEFMNLCEPVTKDIVSNYEFMMCVQEERHPAPAPAPGPSSPQEGRSSSAGVASVPQQRRQVRNRRYRLAILYM